MITKRQSYNKATTILYRPPLLNRSYTPDPFYAVASTPDLSSGYNKLKAIPTIRHTKKVPALADTIASSGDSVQIIALKNPVMIVAMTPIPDVFF